MSTLFSRRSAGPSSITASALILLYQFAQIILVLTVSESLFNATQSIRFGLAIIAMYVLLLALTALYWIEANVVGGLAASWVSDRVSWKSHGRRRLVVRDVHYPHASEPRARDFRGGTARLGAYRRVRDLRGVRCGVVDLWILQLPGRHSPSRCIDSDDARRPRGRRDTYRRMRDPTGCGGRLIGLSLIRPDGDVSSPND
jgi:hypothetical protein